MNTLGLFDGMSCGRIALECAGVEVDNYYASEVDKYAIKVTQANWPETIQLGDVTRWREWGIEWSSIDLLIGGSPCQGFSFAGKQMAFDDPRSKLFFVYIDILNHIKSVNPNVKFLLENVKMKKEHLDVISDYLGVKPIFINSALVSAQSRQRYYWANWHFEEPEDKEVMLVDILDFNEPTDAIGVRVVGRRINELGKRDDYNKDIPLVQRVETRADDKANCMTTVHKDSMVSLRSKSKCLRVGGRGSPLGSKQEWDSPFKIQRVDKKGKPKSNNNKAGCLTGGAHSGGNHSDMDILVIQKPRGFNKGGEKAKNSKTPTLSSCSWEHNNHLSIDNIVRRFTTIECERLQTVPDNYTNHVSNTQRYKMLGNGWTVDVIAHIFKSMNEK